DRRHHLQLVEADVSGIGRTPCWTMVAEDVCDLQRWTRHGGARLRGWPVLLALLRLLAGLGLLAGLRQQVERALDIGDYAGGDARVARRRLQFVVPQQRLDDPDIGAALKEMGREAVAERVQRHALPDPGRFCRLVE